MKKLLLFIITLCTSLTVSARQYTEAEAADIAANLRGDLQTRGMLRKSVTKPTAQLTRISGSNATLAYVFNYSNNDGFVIVAGDDRAGSVIAYSPTGEFNPNKLSPAASAWLNSAKNFVSAAIEGRAVRSTTQNVYDTEVEPLCTSKWGQDAPYNNLCPMMTNSKGEKEHAATGCAATALAQILYYYKAPATGIGTNSVTTADGETITVDFTQSSYDWSAMTDTYDDNSSEASKAAVAKLMLDCGVAMNMEYGPSSEEGSGAESEDMLNSIINVFGMSKNTRYQIKDYFRNHEEWCNMVKAELDARRPLYYCGATAAYEGHAFVCDGYDHNGLFHINWGWDGISDGYFDLHYLDAEEQGTGGAASGLAFSLIQEAFFGMQPTTDESAAIIPYTLYADSLSISLPEDASEEDTHLVFSVCNLENVGYDKFTGKININVYDSNDACVATGEVTDLPESIASYDTIEVVSATIDLADLGEGTYTIRAYSTDASGYTEEIKTSRFCCPLSFTLSEEGIEVKNEYDVEMNVVDMATTTDSTGARTITAKYTITNKDEYEVFMIPTATALFINESGDEESSPFQTLQGDNTTLYLAPNTTSDVLTVTVGGFEYDGNSCYLIFKDMITQAVLATEEVDFDVTKIAAPTASKASTLTASNGLINVDGLSAGEHVSVSDLSGRTLYTGKTAGSSLRVATPTRGLYVVKVGDKVKKIIVK